MQPEPLDVHDLEARALDLGQRLAEPRKVAVRKHVSIEELDLARRLPVELVDDPVVQIEAAVPQPPAHAAEERRIVRNPDVLDHADRGDLVEAGVRGQVTIVAVLDRAAPLEPFPADALGRVVGLRLRQGHAVGAHAVVLRRPDRQAAPAAPDVEQGLAGLELELAADQIELVPLGLLELAVGVAIVRAGVDHQRIEEERVELVGDVVVMGDRLRVHLLAACPHDATSRIPKMRPNTTCRRVAAVFRTARTSPRAHESGIRASCRPSQLVSPDP